MNNAHDEPINLWLLSFINIMFGMVEPFTSAVISGVGLPQEQNTYVRVKLLLKVIEISHVQATHSYVPHISRECFSTFWSAL